MTHDAEPRRNLPEESEHARLLAQVCQAPGCSLLNGAHSAEEITACIERWLLAQGDWEAER